MRGAVALNIELHPKQEIALNTLATEVLFGGAAAGGKSFLMRVAAIIWCGMIPGLQVYLFRRLLDDLIKNHMEGPKGFRAILTPWVDAGLVQIVEGEIRFWNKSKIYLCHCKDEKDRFKYQGSEIHVLLIDELTHFTEIIYRFLRGRVRAVGLNLPETLKGLFPRILASSNPGGVGHHFVKQTFINDAVPYDIRQMGDDEGGMRRQYIPARLDDNPSMAEDDPSYRAKLRGLGSAELVKAMEDGDWSVVAGAFFTEWSSERHVIKPFAVPFHWLRFTSFDWGSARPFAHQWWTVSDGNALTDGRRYPTGAIIMYKQWYGMKPGAADVGLHLTNEKIAKGIIEREKIKRPDGSWVYEKINYRVADPACWKFEGGPSIAEQIYNASPSERRIMFQKADNSRIAGWSQMRARLQGVEGEPMMYVFESCTDFVRTFPALQHDPSSPEDVNSSSEDHDGDAGRYAAQSRPWTIKAPVTLPILGLENMTMNQAWKDAQPKRSNRDSRI